MFCCREVLLRLAGSSQQQKLTQKSLLSTVSERTSGTFSVLYGTRAVLHCHAVTPRANPRTGFFLLAELLSVRCAPVSERAKACKEAKGNKKQTTENRQANTQTKQTPDTKTKTRTPQPRQIPLQQVRHVRRVRRSPHRTGETRGSLRP